MYRYTHGHQVPYRYLGIIDLLECESIMVLNEGCTNMLWVGNVTTYNLQVSKISVISPCSIRGRGNRFMNYFQNCAKLFGYSRIIFKTVPNFVVNWLPCALISMTCSIVIHIIIDFCVTLHVQITPCSPLVRISGHLENNCLESFFLWNNL
jgi:hypothetical protein